MSNKERVRRALDCISAKRTREEWVFVGMGVHDELGEEGWELFDEWSATATDVYNAADTRSTWKSFTQGGGKGFGYVVNLAKARGFDPSKKNFKQPAEAERTARLAQQEERRKIHMELEAREEAEAAVRAKKRWEESKLASDDHPYLKKKGVKSYGLRVGPWWKRDPVTEAQIKFSNVLLVPVKDACSAMWSLQGITENGDKFLLSGGAKNGKFFAIGKPKSNADGKLVYGFAEGYATAATAHELTGVAVLCCFDVGNMGRLVHEVREKKPDAELIIFADNDTKTEVKGRGNPGMTAAYKLGMEHDAAVVYAPDGGDFNDLAQEKGPEAAMAAFDARKVPDAPYLPIVPTGGTSAGDRPTWTAEVRAALSDDLCDDDVALEPAAVRDEDRPVITIERNNVKAINDQAELALVSACPFLYSRGGEIVRPMVATAPDGRGGAVRTVKIRSLRRAALQEHIDAAARWVKYDGRSSRLVPVDAPMAVADALLGRGASSLRPLTGVIQAPTLRADGSILDRAGYDACTGLLFLPNCDYPPVPQEPQKADALAAIKRVETLIDKYPFVAPVDRSVALAAILTCSVRRALNKAPMFALSAPAPGSGKSALVDVASIIVTGSTVPVFAQGENEAEFEKRLHGALLAGHSVVSFDNVTRPIEGNALCQAMTQQTMEVRPLGTSDTRTVPTSTTFFATGNGLVVRADMTRRVLECQLDPGVERPELRTFDFDPLEIAKAQRAMLLVDALTVLRAHRLAQHGARSRRFDFNEWSAMVGDALVWLDYADPAASMDRTRASDPAKDEFRAVAREWTTHFGAKLVSVREAIEAATEQSSASYGSRAEFKRPDFREALLLIANAGGVINSRMLGKWLARHVKFLVDGLTVHKAEGTQGVLRWGIGPALFTGENSPPV